MHFENIMLRCKGMVYLRIEEIQLQMSVGVCSVSL